MFWSRSERSFELGIWGGSQVGKSSFLTALASAALARNPYTKQWDIKGDDTFTIDWLTTNQDNLARGIYPPATLRFDPLEFKLFRERGDVEYHLSTPDPQGGAFEGRSPETEEVILEKLLQANGIIYLFDARREILAAAPPSAGPRPEPNFVAFNRSLQKLAAKLPGRKLPHHLAVCITKFDDKLVFDSAVRRGWVSYDEHPPWRPRVPDSLAKQYLEDLCRHRGADPGEWVIRLIEKHFDPGRVHYFVTSNVGFREEGGKFVSREDSGGGNPVNVLEPVIHLANRVSGSRWRRHA